jgi:PAS domain S-box-containing protein
MNRNRWLPAVRITFLYVFFGFLWIIWSDWLLTLWITDYHVMRIAQIHKGWFFVAVTGIMLFFLIRSSLRKIEETKTSYTLKLQESERQLSTLMANLPGMAFRCRNDKYWTMLFVSRGAEPLTGYTADELINSRVLSYARFIHPEDRRKVLDLISKRVDNKEHYQITYRIITKSGVVKWVRENAVGIFDENNNLLFIEGLIIDISIQKNNEITIKQQLDELERINQELDRFTTSVAHDLRSPLLTIEGYIGLLKQDLEDGNIDGAGKSIKRIRNVIEKMHQLLQDLLKLSRLGKVVNPLKMFPMIEVVEEVKEYLYGILKFPDCTITTEPDMPHVYADKSRIVVVMQNLIENAVKFRRPGQPLLVHIGYSDSGEHPVFFVKDNGIGIDPRHQNQIFELFTRLDRKKTGSGVGLSLVERIIRFHGGKVWVESEGEGHGATFFFSLPGRPPKT